MEQTTNHTESLEADERTSWRAVGAIAGAWADRIAVVRMARAAGEDASSLAMRLGLAAE